jgi:hypothetical protein
MTDHPATPKRRMNWTQILADAGIPEPPWDKPSAPDALAPEIQAPEPEDRENWMHV